MSDRYEVLSGNQRLKALQELRFQSVPCVVVDLNDDDAKLLAQALNAVHGEDDLNQKATLMRQLMTNIPRQRILSLLPETAASLEALSSIGDINLADYLQNWQRAQATKLKNLQLRLTRSQLETVEKALNRAIVKTRLTTHDNPNLKGTAFHSICQFYLENHKEE